MTTRLGKFEVSYQNSEEFHTLKREIFARDLYYFETDTPQPVIFDLGANIGLSVLYFKKLFPLARILAVEPLPENYDLLAENIWQNRLEDSVTTLQVAVAAQPGELTLHSDYEHNWHSTAGVIAGNWTQTQPTQSLTVPAQTLDQIRLDFMASLDSGFGQSSVWEADETDPTAIPIDLLKIDIEGLEQAVLESSKKTLLLTQHLICEFHSHPNQNLSQLVKYLENLPADANGKTFTVKLWKKNKPVTLEQATGLIMLHAQRK